jgi:two-component SAPR family response regulator
MATENQRILVVEDEMLVAMLLQDMLVEIGHTVVGPCARVDETLEALEHETFAAALLDVNLGGVEVYPVAEVLKARDVPFAFVTGYDSRGVNRAWTDRPILEKPFRKDDLARLLDQLLHTRA